MNLREEILREHSKAQSQLIADYVGHNSKRFAELLSLFLNDEYRVVQRAAWTVSLVADQAPEIVAPHLPVMIEKMLVNGQATAVRRNVLRILQKIAVPEEMHGILMDACFGFAADPVQAIAIRSFSLNILDQLAVLYPEIDPELSTVVEAGLEQEPTPAFRTSARRVLRGIEKRKRVAGRP